MWHNHAINYASSQLKLDGPILTVYILEKNIIGIHKLSNIGLLNDILQGRIKKQLSAY